MRLTNKRIAYFVEDGFEDLEFWVPIMRLREEGADVVIIGTGKPEYTGKHGLTAKPAAAAADVKAMHFDAIVIPGGWAPDRLRTNPDVQRIVRNGYNANRIIGVICHAGWVPISAGVVKGHRCTGAPAIKDDLVNAGGTWVDEPAFRDGPFVWGRVVDDIPAFCRELVAAIEAG